MGAKTPDASASGNFAVALGARRPSGGVRHGDRHAGGLRDIRGADMKETAWATSPGRKQRDTCTYDIKVRVRYALPAGGYCGARDPVFAT